MVLKKILSVMMSLMLLMIVPMTVFADDAGTDDGGVTTGDVEVTPEEVVDEEDSEVLLTPEGAKVRLEQLRIAVEGHIQGANTIIIEKVDGVLYDLGVSSFQFDIPERGFSYNYDAILDMRMDQTAKLTAKEIVNNYSYGDIVKILYKYSEEKFAKQIARAIERERKNKPINTTFELVDIIKMAIPMKFRKHGSHPAKKTFQALRIAVNDELQVFEKSLNDALDLLRKDGRIAVISFHSLEDRITKLTFRERSSVNIPKGVPYLGDIPTDYSLINKKIILPTEQEVNNNKRAHSAKLRIIKKN